MKNPKQPPIAVVGVAALFPGSGDKDGFWRDIVAGRDLITDVPPSHWLIDDYYDPDPRARDKTYCKRGAFLSPVDFDPIAWGVPPNIVPSTDTAQLLALGVAQQVLQDAWGGRWKEMPRDRVSVILGVTSAQELLGSMVSRLQRPVWAKSLREMGLSEDKVVEACERIASHYVEWQESTFPGVLGNVVAGRIANRLDLGGSNSVTDAACASSLAALAAAVAELRLGDADLVITGGADTMNDIFMYVCFSKTPALSPTGDCRPFSDRADGTLLGEGVGMLALKRLDDAERDGDCIYAVIKGIGASSDGRAKSVYAPVPAGQASALRRAYQQAGHGPETVELVEAHGTGTAAGDLAEVEALRTVFDESKRTDRNWCALGSVKSQVGHTKAAAGAAGLFKAVMALHHKVLPPTIKVDRPDPRLAIESSPFYLNTATRPWIRDDRYPRRASVSSFGFGGSNFHAALEEYTGPGRRAARVRPAGGEVVLLGGGSADEVAARCRTLAADVARVADDKATGGPMAMLAYLARSTQEAFDATAAARLALFATSDADLAAKLGQAAELVAQGRGFSMPGGIDFAVGAPEGAVAFLFPGQGSQYLGMGADLAMALDAARRVWDRAAALDLAAGEKLAQVVFPQPVFDAAAQKAQIAKLTATEWAQPAIAAHSLALLDVLRDLGVQPAAVAGHSFGEVTALCASGALSSDDLLRVARRRGELMAEAARVPGAMLSVATRLEDLRPLLESWGTGVVVANHNSPNQLVLSGARDAIADVERRLADAGLATSRLEVATAFHSPLVTPASVPLRAFLADVDVRAPGIDVYRNANAAPYPAEPDAIRDTLARQLCEPVLFVDQIEAMYARGIRTFVEIGPGRVLTSLCGHILKKRPHRAIALDRKAQPGLASLHQGLGQLSAAGVAIAYARLWDGFASVSDPRTAPRPSTVMKLGGSSYGKPYPPPGAGTALPKPNPAPLPALAAVAAVAPVPALAAPAAAAPLPAPAPTPAVAPATATHADRGAQLAWVQAFEESQRHTAEVQMAFQRSMAESHAAFLRASEDALASLAAVLGGAPAGFAATARRAEPVAAPAWTPIAASPPVPAPRPVAAPESPHVMTPPPVRPSSASSSPVAPSVPARPAVAVVPPAAELQEILLAVVAAKTGYPSEMLGLDMDLESDLGVDSIKRVEILAAALERAPGLAGVSAAKMASARTLRQIVAYLAGAAAGGNGAAAPTPTSGNGKPAAADPPAASHAASTAVGRFTVHAVPAAALGFATPGLFGAERLVVTDDGDGVGAALCAGLATRGVPASLCPTVPADADVVICLDGLRQPASGLDQAIEINAAAFRAVRAVAAPFATRGGTLVIVQDTGGDFGASGSERAWLAGPAALARTAALEWPAATVRALDVERGTRTAEVVAEAIVAELLEGGVENEVGLRADGSRVTLVAARSELAGAGALPLSTSSVVVASGGARGVTAACMVALAEAARCRFLLLGRTEPADEPAACRGIESEVEIRRALLTEARQRGETPGPAELGQQAAAVLAGREIRATLAAIARAGGEARYLGVDVTDAAAVAAALAEARAAWGPITAVVHGAGVLADKLLADKTDAQWQRVFRTKVAGLHALLDATRGDDLSLLLLFSSVAASAGNRGQSDYAMANEVLNKVATLEQRRRGSRCLVRALGWGPWDGGMVDDDVRARFAALGVPIMPVAVGTRLLLGEIVAAGPEAEVVLGGPENFALHRDHGGVREITREIVVDRSAYPFLDGHRVKGAVVVPVALVLEWFARAAHACRPDLQLSALRGVQVLRGIRLPGFDAGGVEGAAPDRLIVRARQLSNGSSAELALELAVGGGPPSYTATCEMAERRPISTRLAPVLSGLAPWSGPLYGGVLFHGPAFQVIRSVEGLGESGIVAELTGVAERRWPGSFQLDAAVLDGGLQVALLWAEQRLGGATLPTAIERLAVYRAGLPQGPVRCVLAGRQVAYERAVADVTFAAEDGSVIAELRGVEVHLLPRSHGVDASSEPDLVDAPAG